MKNKKILVLGQGRHGKDTVAEILRDSYGMTFQSSSRAMFEVFIYDLFKAKYGYTSMEGAYADRHSHREELFKLISDYNAPDKTKLAQAVLSKSDVYVGMRCAEEVEACMQTDLFDLIIWVDASSRVSYQEPSSSITATSAHADVVLDNNGSLKQLRAGLHQILEIWGMLED